MEKVDQENLDEVVVLADQFASETRLDKLDTNHFKAFWNEVLNQQRGVIFLARKVTDVVGIIGGVLYESPINGEHNLEEIGWYVDPKHRGDDVGEILLNAFEDWGQRMGVNRIMMSMIEGQSNLQEFYQSNGYEPVEITYEKVI